MFSKFTFKIYAFFKLGMAFGQKIKLAKKEIFFVTPKPPRLTVPSQDSLDQYASMFLIIQIARIKKLLSES